ncbi:hypothetical protein K435DRAFT_881403 [Dendrothele bispora CBS 962.96]|uniref:Uncharacterized protein n=1 Tax=Dendrothele bispora (strain CBS 962.96) TaxID=1314807 RepID=A0A4S8KIP3_DENBC|nr:hypothetical protein K435DRAFT_881403 [Dendrothele bispora CBS 962.96]
MPPQKKWLKKRAENLAGSIKTGLKRAAESCSPKRNRKKQEVGPGNSYEAIHEARVSAPKNL